MTMLTSRELLGHRRRDACPTPTRICAGHRQADPGAAGEEVGFCEPYDDALLLRARGFTLPSRTSRSTEGTRPRSKRAPSTWRSDVLRMKAVVA